MLDYSLDNLAERAAAAKTFLADELDKYRRLFCVRRDWRREHGLPVLSIVGFGRAGKDTFAELLGKVSKLKYGGSTSLAVLPLVCHAVGGTSRKRVYDDRHHYRAFWFHFCNALRVDEPGLIAKMLLAHADILVGVRGRAEFDCLVPDFADANVWVSRDGVRRDLTVEFQRSECDFVVDNDGTVDDLERKASRLAGLLKISK